MRSERMFRPAHLIVLVLGVWLGPGNCHPASAAKFIEARIERDGEIILKTSYTASDTEEIATIWERLDRVSFQAKNKLAPDTDNAQQATLAGRLRLVIVWRRDELLASATLDTLRLIRVPGAEDRWQIPRDEVERTAQAAGLSLAGPSLPWPAIAAAIIASFVLLGAGFWLIVRRRRASGGSSGP